MSIFMSFGASICVKYKSFQLSSFRNELFDTCIMSLLIQSYNVHSSFAGIKIIRWNTIESRGDCPSEPYNVFAKKTDFRRSD